MTTTNDASIPVPTGTWLVDAGQSELGFDARGMFGLVPVHGHFETFTGTLVVDGAGASGELTVQTATLDTHNAKRDKHLRGPDFFDVENYPTLAFELTGVQPGAAGTIAVSGVLRVCQNTLAISAPVAIADAAPDRLTLTTTLEVDRAAAGVGWSKMGMIKGKARLSARIALMKQA